MKSNVLLGLGLCLSLFMTSCKDDDANPKDLQVSIQSSSQTLVEGGETVELTVEMDRAYNELKYLYLEGAGVFMDRDVPHLDGGITVEIDGKQRSLTRIPMPAGERKRTVHLRVDRDEVYQGNSTFEVKVYSYENGEVQPKSSLSMDYQDVTPKPVFGFFKMDERDVSQTLSVSRLNHQGRFFIHIMADRPFTQPQNVTLAFSGTAEDGLHYEKQEQLLIHSRERAFLSNSYEALSINRTGNFNPEKTIHIKLTAAEDGKIANGEEYIWPNPYGGEPFNMVNTYTLTITE